MLVMARRPAISDSLRLFGFGLLLLTTILFNSFPVMPHSEFIWMGFLAGYSFYFLNALQSIRLRLLG